MRKKIFIVSLIVFFISVNSFSESYYLDVTDFINSPEDEWLTIRILTNDQYGILKGYKKDGKINSELSIERECSSICLENFEHFLRDKNSYIENGKKINRYFITGKGLFMEEKLSLDCEVPVWIPYEMRKNKNDVTSYDYYTWKKYKEDSQYFEEAEAAFTVKIYDAGIKNIVASSYLTENTRKGMIKYVPENLIEKVFYRPLYDYNFIQYDFITPPWVEGNDGYGIGEFLDIEFKWPSDEVQILNGFVDFTRVDLYEKNSRVKTVLIESENPKFSEEYQLEDLAKYTVINLPQKTDKIRITIKDIYPGTKYKDTCLSSILVTNPNAISFNEMTEMVLTALSDGSTKVGSEEATKLTKFINGISGR